MAHTPLVKSVFQLPIVLGRDQIRDGFAEVPEKAIASFGAFDNSPGQHWQPRRRLVTAKFFELRHHVVSPVLRAGFPAVIDHVLNAFLTHLIRPNSFFVAVEVFLEIILHVAAIKLVHLKPRGLGCCRMIRDSHQ